MLDINPKAAAAIVAPNISGAPSDRVYPRAAVYAMGGATPEDMAHKNFGLWAVRFDKALRESLLESDGRWFATVRGEGFRLLGPDDSVHAIASDAERLARNKIANGKRRIRLLRADALTMDGRQARTRATIRLGMLAKSIAGE